MNEEGTEAIASTAVILTNKCAESPKSQYRMKVDRTFLFFVVDTKEKLVLFGGKVEDPQ
jgi:serine protease inhibitor